ncbi:hypothetical protein O3P69_011880 [Scylla paramamosain]|uniref:Uncharacterized protein n=1 Tax=Scylla paramamosain TaxID=85552 RepID=A0AAW0SAF0_SCYPA
MVVLLPLVTGVEVTSRDWADSKQTRTQDPRVCPPSATASSPPALTTAMNHITQEEPPPPTSDKDLLELMDTQGGHSLFHVDQRKCVRREVGMEVVGRMEVEVEVEVMEEEEEEEEEEVEVEVEEECR